MSTQVIQDLIEAMEAAIKAGDWKVDGACDPDSAIQRARETLAQPEQERCVGCEACIDTACGRDECPKGWPKAAQPEQEPVANEQDAFEQKFGMPINCTRFTGGYAATNHNAWDAHAHCLRWEGWKARANTTPPQRTWVGLTDTEKYALADDVARRGVPVFEAICEAEAKLRKKNK